MRRYDVDFTINISAIGVAGESEDDARVAVANAVKNLVEDYGYQIQAGLSPLGEITITGHDIDSITDDYEN